MQSREKYNLSQGDVAKLLQVTTPLISSYERGERMPNPTKLILPADLYHTTTDYILCRNFAQDENIWLSLKGLSSRQMTLIRELVDSIKQSPSPEN